ncbi:MAG: hypothetical protein KAS32_11145 [Candidatus Peribacteraceae bacterium]|nr:hypothetical protein [Candidatus Peribacteraceae bacterium]
MKEHLDNNDNDDEKWKCKKCGKKGVTLDEERSIYEWGMCYDCHFKND